MASLHVCGVYVMSEVGSPSSSPTAATSGELPGNRVLCILCVVSLVKS